MKIENKLTTPFASEVPTENRAFRNGGGGGAPRAGGDGASVDVRLSDLAARLQAIEGRMAGSEVVDAAKVAEIRQAIAEGRFQINAEAIADRLLDTVRELLAGERK
ncbi:MAG: flagellar biosynthesis anti-sigma factor FlgM [Burkholderiales bacterium]|nr:flagellar biosynthesis anti-sigma factor FlgM [Burkholderiales bacterium]